jgi:hypothetical protein
MRRKFRPTCVLMLSLMGAASFAAERCQAQYDSGYDDSGYNGSCNDGTCDSGDSGYDGSYSDGACDSGYCDSGYGGYDDGGYDNGCDNGYCDTCGYNGECDYRSHYGHRRLCDCMRNGSCADNCCLCGHHGWDGKRQKSFQQQKDLFYNYYAQPGPFYNTAGKMYVCPQPVPANVGHTYVTYQPFMPHEYMYHHKRAYYTHNPGAGWTRTNVRYGTCGNWCRGACMDWHYPMTANLWPLNQDFYRPGLQW